MDLYILRHGIAVERGTPGYDVDADRPLTPRGVRRTARIARGIRALGLRFDVILTSPCVRALRTAELTAQALRARHRLRISKNLVSEGDPRALVREIAGMKPAPGAVLLVGHEPYLSGLISTLTTGGGLGLLLRKGGLCRLTAEKLRYGRCAMLRWLLPPSLLVRFRYKGDRHLYCRNEGACPRFHGPAAAGRTGGYLHNDWY